MIKITDKYELERDKYQWILTERIPSKGKDGEPIVSEHSTYHLRLPDACKVIMDKEGGRCESVEGLRELYRSGVDRLAAAVEVAQKRTKTK